jgi:hypothetical protein
MKSAAPSAVASVIPITAGKLGAVPQHNIPLPAKVAGTAFLAVLVPVYWHTFFYSSRGAHLANSNTPINLNYLYGFNDRQPQTWINQDLYVIMWLGALWLVAFLPTHLALRKIFTAPRQAGGQWPHTAHLPLSTIDLRNQSRIKTGASGQAHN